METLAREQYREKTTVNTTYWQNLVALGEENRFGVIAIALLVVGCLGGLTMMYGAAHNLTMLIAVVVPTMLTLSMLLAVAPMRFIYFAFALAVITDLTVIMALNL